MAFTVHFQSTEPISSIVHQSLSESLAQLTHRHHWAGCEPPVLADELDASGKILGSCRPNFMPIPDDYLNCDSKRLPDGSIHDVIDILSQLSSEFVVDWQLDHDHHEGPIGFIRNGSVDIQLKLEITHIAGIGTVVADALAHLPEQLPSHDPESQDSNDDEPRILKFQAATTPTG